MKHLLLLLSISIFCLPFVKAQQAIADSVITKELLQHHVQVLAHDSMEGRLTGTAGCEKAAAYIAAQMKATGLHSFNDSISFYQFYKMEKGRKMVMAANIVGVLPGRIPDKYIIFSAHYDHVGNADKDYLWQQLRSSKKDKIYNGANDNASGVAAMLALAAYFKALQENDYTILFIAFSGEENGLAGSQALVNSFRKLDNIRQVVNLEMLGRLSATIKKPFVTEGMHSEGFRKKLNDNLRKLNPRMKDFFRFDGLPEEHYFSRSDNYSFALQGIPANSIMATNGFDRHYHSPGDEWQTLDYDAMTTIVKAIALACTALVQEETSK
ncbi:MAG: M20/M25/M40 family metallo-hydrolase [Ferruginibacter sp.]